MIENSFFLRNLILWSQKNCNLTLRLRCIFWKWSKFRPKFSFNNQTSNSISGVLVASNKTIIPPIERKFNSLSNHGSLEANEANFEKLGQLQHTVAFWHFQDAYVHWRIQHYCKIHGGEHKQKIKIKLRHNVLLMISSENFAVLLYTPLMCVLWSFKD